MPLHTVRKRPVCQPLVLVTKLINACGLCTCPQQRHKRNANPHSTCSCILVARDSLQDCLHCTAVQPRLHVWLYHMAAQRLLHDGPASVASVLQYCSVCTSKAPAGAPKARAFDVHATQSQQLPQSLHMHAQACLQHICICTCGGRIDASASPCRHGTAGQGIQRPQAPQLCRHWY